MLSSLRVCFWPVGQCFGHLKLSSRCYKQERFTEGQHLKCESFSKSIRVLFLKTGLFLILLQKMWDVLTLKVRHPEKYYVCDDILLMSSH